MSAVAEQSNSCRGDLVPSDQSGMCAKSRTHVPRPPSYCLQCPAETHARVCHNTKLEAPKDKLEHKRTLKVNAIHILHPALPLFVPSCGQLHTGHIAIPLNRHTAASLSIPGSSNSSHCNSSTRQTTYQSLDLYEHCTVVVLTPVRVTSRCVLVGTMEPTKGRILCCVPAAPILNIRHRS